jgi:hypothetical protein
MPFAGPEPHRQRAFGICGWGDGREALKTPSYLSQALGFGHPGQGFIFFHLLQNRCCILRSYLLQTVISNRTGFVNLGWSSSDLTVAEMSDLIELIHAFGANHGVVFHDQERVA